MALLAVSLVVEAARWALHTLAASWWLTPALIVVGGGGLGVWGRVRAARAALVARRLAGLRLDLPALDAMSPAAFESAVRDLMLRDGITARQVGGADDQAADVIGHHPPSGKTIVVQCKHTVVGANVGTRVIYEVNGTAGPVHKADVAVVVTNGGFTRSARGNAEQFRMALIDRALLARWAERGAGLDELLGLQRRRGRYRLKHRPTER